MEVPHSHLTGSMGVSPHSTSYKSFASSLTNVLALYLVKSLFIRFFKVTSFSLRCFIGKNYMWPT